GLPSFDIDIQKIISETESRAVEKRAAARAVEVLSDPTQYDHIKEGKFEMTGSIPKTQKIRPGVDLPAARAVGRKNGQLFTGAVVLTPTVRVPGTANDWEATIRPAPMYDAAGNKVEVLGPQTVTVHISVGAGGALVLRLPD